MASPARSPLSPDPESGPSASTSTAISHLTFPTPAAEPTLPTHTPAQPRQLLKERLYVGNLHPTVDEYTLLQLFTKYGKVSKLDFLFHKAGPLRGKPRGYAFVEFAESDDADRALAATHDRLLRGRRLTVTHAHQAPLDVLPPGMRPRRPHDAAKPTALSMLKSVGVGRADATSAKIAKMEAKLRQMSATPAVPTASSSSNRPIPLHPSLPPRPAPPSRPPARGTPNTKAALPALPISPPGAGTSASASARQTGVGPVGPTTHAHMERKHLAGVRIVKKK